MRQAKYRKILWVILLAELALLHLGVGVRLYVLRWEYPQVRRPILLFPIWAVGTLLLGAVAVGVLSAVPSKSDCGDCDGGGGLDSQRLRAGSRRWGFCGFRPFTRVPQ